MLVVAALLILLFFIVCHLNNHLCLYWERRGIPYVPATSLFSKKILSSFLITTSMLSEIYEEAKGRSIIGFFQMRVPVLMVCRPDIINFVLNKEFSSFSSTRTSECSTESDPLSQHLLALNGEKWKSVRSKLTPAFSSGKLKNMFPIIERHADQFVDILAENEDVAIDAEEFCGRFSITSILSCSFGLETSWRNRNNDKFVQIGKSAFEAGFWRLAKARFRMMFPGVFNLLRLDGYVKGHKNFCEGFIREVIEHRKRTGFYRPDFVEILMKLKNEEEDNDKSSHGCLSDSLIIAQVFSFLVAGYETSTTSLSCALFELAQDRPSKQRLRTEIRDTLGHYGSLNYESISQMEFLDQVVKEALRKHPPVIFLPRVCTKETNIPGTSIRIEEGTQLLVPVLALHRDPKYYPYPDEFIPQRFANNSTKISLPDFPYLPFSEGPRKCIGMRFALLEMKIALAKIVANFEFELDKMTARNITAEEYARTYKIKSQIKIIFKRSDCLTYNSL